MQFFYVKKSGTGVALVALAAATGLCAGAARSQAIRVKNPSPARLAQLPEAGAVVSIDDFLKANKPAKAPVADIAPANDAMALPAPVAIAPAAAPAPKAPEQALITVTVTDIPVSDLITMIAEQGNVGIIVSADVNTKVKNVNLVDQTPEAAIRMIAESNGYKWRKLDSKTFAIAKTMEELPPVDNIMVVQPQLVDRMPVPQPRAPQLELPELISTQRNEEPRIYSYMKIRNVTPRWIAWWLDPAHNPLPYEVKASQDALAEQEKTRKYRAVNGFSPEDRGVTAPKPESYNPWAPSGSVSRNGDFGQFSNDVYTQANAQRFGGQGGQGGRGQQGGRGGRGQGGAAGSGPIFTLPDGIESLVAVDPQNALLVLGTPEGIQQLEQIIGFLDRPLRQVEIEAQFVTVSTTFSKNFGIDFTSSNGPFRLNTTGRAPAPLPGSVTVGFVRNNFRATLSALEANGNAKTVAAPRVTAINNLPASITSTVATPITLTETTQNLNGGNTQSTNPANYILTSTGLNVTPTINNDDTVTVVFSPFVSANTPIAGQQAPQISTQQIFTIANVKDGDTIALGGLRTKRLTSSKTGVPILRDVPILGRLFESNNRIDAEDDLIIFLTARIIRRIDDPVPGT